MIRGKYVAISNLEVPNYFKEFKACFKGLITAPHKAFLIEKSFIMKTNIKNQRTFNIN